MSENYKISNQHYSLKHLQDYAKENWNTLRKCFDRTDKTEYRVLANDSGWITVATENGCILQMWAGELSLCA